MSRLRAGAAATLGLLCVLGGVVVAVNVSGTTAWFQPLLAGLTLIVVVIAGLKLYRTPDDAGGSAAPWTDEGALVDRPPERTPDDEPISGTILATRIEIAIAEAREAETVEQGFDVVRPDLRATLSDVLVRSGTPPNEVDRLLATGQWTDDRAAASVVDDRVDPPEQTLRDRLVAWLFPERVIRQRVDRTVREIAHVAAEELPTLVGQRAPRNVPVTRPTVENLQRSVDGELRPATEPLETTSRTVEQRVIDGNGPDGATGHENGPDGATGHENGPDGATGHENGTNANGTEVEPVGDGSETADSKPGETGGDGGAERPAIESTEGES